MDSELRDRCGLEGAGGGLTMAAALGVGGCVGVGGCLVATEESEGWLELLGMGVAGEDVVVVVLDGRSFGMPPANSPPSPTGAADGMEVDGVDADAAGVDAAGDGFVSVTGAERSFVTAFFSLVPRWI